VTQRSLSRNQGSADLFSRSAAFPAVLVPTSEQFKDSFALRDEAPIPNSESQTPAAVLRMKLIGANPHAKVSGLEQLPGKSNYFIGNDPKKWRTNVSNYAKVKYANVDLVYYGNQGKLEYDFVVQPGADPREIALDVGAGLVPAQGGHPQGVPLRIDGHGDLVVGNDGGEVIFHKPVVYQQNDDGNRRSIDGRYVLGTSQSAIDNRQSTISFKLAPYDRGRPVIIDPTLAYSTYLGGSGGSGGNCIAVEGSGNAYVTGTAGPGFPTTPGAFQGQLPGRSNAFVSKLNAAGSALVYSTYLGGNYIDAGSDIAVDASGNAYVTGGTSSSNFPTTPGAFQTTKGRMTDAFVSKLNAAGSALLYSTYHPLLLFNGEGDCLGAKLRPGNVHSAEDCEEVLLPEIERQQGMGKEVVFRADAAFAKPEIYEALEERRAKYAIRLPANDNLLRDIEELLMRPVGPSHKPIVWYKGFLYQAASWKTARGVVAKVEFHAGELFPRLGFIVTNLETPSRAVVRFYKKRGAAEQLIKEGKQAVKMTRLSCHRFEPSAAGAEPANLQSGEFVAASGFAERD
jgi:Transposase DDE domain group 1/Beta-propeller repeat